MPSRWTEEGTKQPADSTTASLARNYVDVPFNLEAIRTIVQHSTDLQSAGPCPCFDWLTGRSAISDREHIQLAEPKNSDDIYKQLWAEGPMSSRRKKAHQGSWDERLSITFGHKDSSKVRAAPSILIRTKPNCTPCCLSVVGENQPCLLQPHVWRTIPPCWPTVALHLPLGAEYHLPARRCILHEPTAHVHGRCMSRGVCGGQSPLQSTGMQRVVVRQCCLSARQISGRTHANRTGLVEREGWSSDACLSVLRIPHGRWCTSSCEPRTHPGTSAQLCMHANATVVYACSIGVVYQR